VAPRLKAQVEYFYWTCIAKGGDDGDGEIADKKTPSRGQGVCLEAFVALEVLKHRVDHCLCLGDLRLIL
jgi:hypothetical protein